MIHALFGMKRLLVLFLVMGAVSYVWERHKRAEAERMGPEEITEPVYAELNTRLIQQGHPIELFMYVKTANAAECERALTALDKDFAAQATQSGLPPMDMTSRCTAELGQAQLDLFDNHPTSVTYLSMERGSRAEREIRLILWGIPAAASDANCNRVIQSQWPLAQRKGAVRCIRSLMV